MSNSKQCFLSNMEIRSTQTMWDMPIKLNYVKTVLGWETNYFYLILRFQSGMHAQKD